MLSTSQQEQVHNHLIKNGSITSWEAITHYRITRLSEYIRALRSMGLNITSTWEHNKETGKRWVRYDYIEYKIPEFNVENDGQLVLK